MYCSNCGVKNPENSSSCNKCGHTLPALNQQNARSFEATAGPAARADGKATASLILGILSITILSILAGIPAVILGHLSRSAIRRSMGELKGAGMALAGLIMGYLSIAVIPFLIVVATIAIPGLLRSRQGAEEAAAVASLAAINTAEITYRTSFGGNYGTISELISAELLADRYATTVGGYTFSITSSGTEYRATAMPTSPNSGRYGFVSTSDAVVRYQTESNSTCMPCFPPGESGQPVREH